LHGFFYVLLQLLVVAAIILSFIVSFIASFVVVMIPPLTSGIARLATVMKRLPDTISTSLPPALFFPSAGVQEMIN